jgi:hypothetical protein
MGSFVAERTHSTVDMPEAAKPTFGARVAPNVKFHAWGLAAGTYFCVLNTGGAQVSRSIVLTH